MKNGRLKALLLPSAIAFALLFAALPAFPRSAPRGNPNLFGPEFGAGTQADIEEITNYYPEKGDSMNGKCGAGGGTRPKDPCKHLLEMAMSGAAECAVAATQRKTGSAPLYGCKTEVPQMTRILGKKINVCFNDVYASTEEVGRNPRSGKMNPAKFDLAVKIDSAQGKKLLGPSNGKGPVKCSGRVENTQNTKRQPERKEEAKEQEQQQSPPPGGGAPPGGGGAPPGGGGSPSSSSPPPSGPPGSAEYPTPVNSPTGPSYKPDPDPPRKQPPPGGISPKDISNITKRTSDDLPSANGGDGNAPPFVAPKADLGAAGSATPGAGFTAARASAPGGGGGGLGGGGDGGGGKGEPEAGRAVASSSGSGAPSGGGGGGGGGGGDSGGGAGPLSPFGAAKKGQDGDKPEFQNDGGPESFGAEGEALVVAEQEPGFDAADGIADRDSPSLFERVRFAHIRFQRGRK